MRPKELVVHVRHPSEAAIQSVVVNGRAHADYSAETVRVASPPAALEIEAWHG